MDENLAMFLSYLDDVTTTELVFNKCVKHIDTIEHLGDIFKPYDFAINYAVENGAEKVAKFLIDNGANVNALDKHNYGITPLHWAARRSGFLRPVLNYHNISNYVNLAKLLIDNNANVHAKDEFGHTPLHSASKVGGLEVAQMLIQKGADVNAKTKHGYTPIFEAAEFNKANMTQFLIDNGADISTRNDKGFTPLLFSAACGTKDVLKVLIDNKAEINAQDSKGNTAFHLIASYSKLKMWKLFHFQTKIKRTIFSGRSNNSYYADGIKFLMENGADTSLKNNVGKTACEIAVEEDKTTLIPVLGCAA